MTSDLDLDLLKIKEIDIIEIWNQVDNRISKEKADLEADLNPSWKTVRIFVSSTFNDFHSEREVLVKEVFPDLRVWCESRRIHLVECDLRWGVPKDQPNDTTVRICLSEIERCRSENKHPYFINMTSERIGWILIKDKLSENIIEEFKIIMGFSITEMEIINAAYCLGNPNAIFLIRNDEFLKEISDEEIKKKFLDKENLRPIAENKLTCLKDKIKCRFENNQLVEYSCSYTNEKIHSTGEPKLILDEIFKEKVYEFFKKRIEYQYPLVDQSLKNPLKIANIHHEDFMTKISSNVYGRKDFVNDNILAYIKNDICKPLMLIGESGSGKTAVMALAITKTIKEITDEKLLFYHFTGAVPFSTSLILMLKRLLKRLSPNEEAFKLDDAIQSVLSFLNQKRLNKKIIIFVDAVNQFDEKDCEKVFSWVPQVLSSNLKIIFSVIEQTKFEHRAKEKFDLMPLKLPVLNNEDRYTIIKEYLYNFRKVLDTQQIMKFLDKKSSDNPLYLVVACEELRVFGSFRGIDEKIVKLPHDIKGLLNEIIDRFAVEDSIICDKDLIISTLCLLEVSKSGLLEVELLEMLAPLDTKTDYTASMQSNIKANQNYRPRLLYPIWASIYRYLRLFIRPYGSPGEDRLNFYHQALRFLVKESYLSKNDGEGGYINDEEKRKKYHTILAEQFELTPNYDRKIEEYPYHLMQLNDKKRMKIFLLDWTTFDILYNSEYSPELIQYWHFTLDGNFKNVKENYLPMLDKFKKKPNIEIHEIISKLEMVARFLSQCGMYKDALDLAEESLKLNSLEQESEEQMLSKMYLYGHIAHLYTMIKKENDYDYLHIIDLHNKAIQIGKEYWKHDFSAKKFVALQLTKKAYCLGQASEGLRSGFFSSNKKENMLKEAIEINNQAKELYTELNLPIYKLETELTKATLIQKAAEKHKIHREILDQVRDMYGPLHILSMRTYYNDGLVYEADKDLKSAYWNFKNAYQSSALLYGLEHSKTRHYEKILLEEKYKKISLQLKDDYKKNDFIFK